jgi:predicted permease
MRWPAKLTLRIRSIVRTRDVDRELDSELRFHLDRQIAENLADGMSPDQARRDALALFGGVSQIQEDCRDMRRIHLIYDFRQDLRYTLRTLRNSPAFACAAILSLALGIGANSAIFTLLNDVVLRLLPVPQPEQLVQLTYTYPGNGAHNWNSYFGYPQYERFLQRSQTLSGIFGGVGAGRLNVGYRTTSGLAQGDAYTPSLFAVTGLVPQAGRFFAPDEDRADATVAILSNRYWRTRFAADPTIIGETITLNQIPYTVIGVTPPEFTGLAVGTGPDLWIPLRSLDRLNPSPNRWTESFTSWLTIAGRLRSGVSQEQAQAELDVLYRQLNVEQLAAARRPGESLQRMVRESHLELRTAAGGVFSGLRDRYELPLKLLMGVAGLVLLIACANIANLLLARASARHREIALRQALGASRSRILRQTLTESLVLAVTGGVCATALAWWGATVLIRMLSTGDRPLPLDAHPDWRVMAFTAAITLITGIAFGVAPTLRSTRPTRPYTLDRILVVAQIALSVILVIGAGLFVRTLQKLWTVDTGYSRDNVLMFAVDAKLAGYSGDRATRVYSNLFERLRALSGVRSAGASIVRPVDNNFSLVDVLNEIDGVVLADRDRIRVSWNSVSPGYFSTIGTPMLAGRDFDSRDTETSTPVVIVNETLARRAFPGQNPLGHRIGLATVVGVVKDSLYNGARDKPRSILFRNLFQPIGGQPGWAFVSYELRYRTEGNLLDLARREVAEVDRNLPVFQIRTLRTQTEQSLLAERLLAMLSSFFGVLALLLACLGLYGLMAYAVSRRTSEIGVRLALGARGSHILWLVFRETLLLTAAGLAIGIPLAFWAARYARAILFGIDATDPLIALASAAALMAATALAAYFPARRATGIDPLVALRCE